MTTTSPPTGRSPGTLSERPSTPSPTPSSAAVLDAAELIWQDGYRSGIPEADNRGSIPVTIPAAADSDPLVLSNVDAREPFRHRTYIMQVAHAVIAGASEHGYRCAFDLLTASRAAS